MSLIVLIGPQAVGKMTIGKELEKKIDGKLLFNHQTIDLYADFLGFTRETFRLSDVTRINLFESFVKNTESNLTKSIIFTVLINFDSPDDIDFLQRISTIFIKAKQAVYFTALSADLETRLIRNTHEERLKAKPSKRDIEFSRNELIASVENYRLTSTTEELKQLFPQVSSMTVDNTHLFPVEVADLIIKEFHLN